MPFAIVVDPVFETEKSVDVAKAEVDEPIEKAVVPLKVEDARKMERFAYGEVVPMPTLPALVTRNSVEVELLVEEPTAKSA